MTEPLRVFRLALLTAVATGPGALPFVFVKDMKRSWLGASNTLAVTQPKTYQVRQTGERKTTNAADHSPA